MIPKIYLGLLWSAVVSSASAATLPAIPPKLPVEDFVRYPVAGGVAVSPDGKTMAYEIRKGGEWMLAFQEWDSAKLITTSNGATGSTPVWLNNERVVYGDSSSIDRTGKYGRRGFAPAWAAGFLFGRFSGEMANGFLAANPNLDYPDVTLFMTRNEVAPMRPTVVNPGHVTSWLVDGAGFVRAGIEEQKGTGKTRVIVRSTADSPWVTPAGLEFAKDKIKAEWLSADGQLLYYTKVTAGGMWGLYTYSLGKEQEKEEIISHTKYDIFPAGAVLAPATREPLGFYYQTDKQQHVWFDPQLDALQQALDQILPGKSNEITSMSDDQQHLIIYSSSARDPGKYFQFDLAKKSLKPLYPREPWIKPEQMAEMYPVSYQARDGLIIHGYLTLPVGRGPKKLPLVVLPHENFFERNIWGFSRDVQFLANRGYAVLQVNFRGSVGYGQGFKEKGRRQLAGQVQDDIADGTHWAIDQGIADPNRIAIVGHGFGGFSALMGVIRYPGLYRCAISIGGRTDWTVKRKYAKDTRALYKEYVGDPETDSAVLADISPVNHVEQISAPVFVIYDNMDDYYLDEYDQFANFAQALAKQHKTCEVMDTHNEMESLYAGKNHLALFTRIDAFLAKYVPSDNASAPIATSGAK